MCVSVCVCLRHSKEQQRHTPVGAAWCTGSLCIATVMHTVVLYCFNSRPLVVRECQPISMCWGQRAGGRQCLQSTWREILSALR